MSLYRKLKSKQNTDETKVEKENEMIALVKKIRGELLLKIESENLGEDRKEELKTEISQMLDKHLLKEEKFLPKEEKELLTNQIIRDINGLGPLQPLLDDPAISEIMVNGPNQIFIERSGKIVETDQSFLNNDHVLNIIEKVVSPLGRRIDESSPMVDARLKDGSRFNAVIPPLALNGPTLTIRKFKKDVLEASDLVQFGTINDEMATYLRDAVKNKQNILVAGGTGSGKTTLLNILSSFIPKDERIITIEDAAELHLKQPHVVSMETRPPNIEGKGEITIRDLLRNSLRMRPDRIIVGEVRGGEALDMLQAMNTGHSGSLSTIHANTPRDVLSRLETLLLMAGFELPVSAIRQQIASAIDLIVLQKRFTDGTRKVTHITSVEGMQNDMITLQDQFVFEVISTGERIKGKFKKTGFL